MRLVKGAAEQIREWELGRRAAEGARADLIVAAEQSSRDADKSPPRDRNRSISHICFLNAPQSYKPKPTDLQYQRNVA